MSHSFKSDLFRAWQGYRLMFSRGQAFRLDDNRIPIFRSKKLTSAQENYAARNIKNVMKLVDPDYVWLFCFAASVRQMGVLPHPFALDLSDSEIASMWQNFKDYVQHDHIEDYNKLKNMKIMELLDVGESQQPKFIDMLMAGEVSIIAVMRYNKHQTPLSTNLINRRGLISDRLRRVLAVCYELEKHHDFSGKLVAQRRNLV